MRPFCFRKEIILALIIINKASGCFVTINEKPFKAFTLESNVFGEKIDTALPRARFLRRSSSELAMDFGGIGNFFNLNNNNDGGDNDEDLNYEDNEDYVGCTNIFKIDAKQKLKVGGCRLYLSLFFMGESNNPEKGTWRMNQNGDGGIDLYYKDTTGALIVVFKEHAILVNRLGSSPSMEYLIQESSMLNGMLDQLEEIATDTSIEESDRLLSIESDKINMVRETLSFT